MGPSYLVGVTELNLTSEGHLPRVDIQPAVNKLELFQVPPNAMEISLGKTEDYWRKATMDRFLTLSIGTPITSDLAFMTMFNEQGRIEGGVALKTDEYGSERLYGPKRYPESLRMLSKEVGRDGPGIEAIGCAHVQSTTLLDAGAGGSAGEGDHCIHVQPGSGDGICHGFSRCPTGNGTGRLLHRTRGTDLRPSVAREEDDEQ